MSSLSTIPKGDSAWLLRKSLQRVMQQVSVLETNIGSSTTGNSANTQIIFNDAGTLRGDAQFTWNKTLNRLTVDGDETITGDLTINNDATITGDLTVDTSTLKVDSTNNRVGIVQASPAYPLDVTGIIHSTQDVYALGGRLALYRSAGASYFDWSTSQDLVWRQVTSVSGAGASTLMTLNATGLGVGVVPSSFGRFSVQGTAGGAGILGMNTNATQCDIQSYTMPLALNRAGNNITMCEGGGNVGVGVTPAAKLDLLVADAAEATRFRAASGWLRIHPYLNATDNCRLQAVNGTNTALIPLTLEGQTVRFNTNVGLAATLDASGNVGISVTPSAWSSAYKAIELLGGNINTSATNVVRIYQNITAITSGLVYKTGGLAATGYVQSSGSHFWQTAPVGANANDPLTLTTYMTLDASGNLILLPSNTPATLATNGQLTVNATSNTNLRFSYRGSDGTTRVANITLA